MNRQPQRILVTGAAGFIGSNLVRRLLITMPEARIIALDALTYAGVRENLDGLPGADRLRFVRADIRDAAPLAALFAEEDPDVVIHLAAESHVDRSIDGPEAFLTTNVLGTFRLLDAARQAWKGRTEVLFHHVSTDEVFGSLGDSGAFDEGTAYDPSSPYSASKAASDHLVRAWHRTYGLPVTISNCSNNYGPWQFPEKLIPLCIANALAGRPLPVYGSGSNVRDWLFVEDHCAAIERIVRTGELGRTYCVGGGAELRNLDVVHAICDELERQRPSGRAGGYRSQIEFVRDRPGHDHRYAIDPQRIRDELAWTPAETFASGLAQTIAWYLGNQLWVERIHGRSYDGMRLGLKTA